MRDAIFATVAIFVAVGSVAPAPPPVAPDVPCGSAIHQSRSAPGTPELEAAADAAFAEIEEKASTLAEKDALALLDTFPAAFRSTRAALRIEWLRLRIGQRGR